MKKSTKMLSCLLVSLLMLSGCTQTPADNNNQSSDIKDGTYTASEKGYGGDVTVTLTVSSGTISDVAIEGADETKTIGQAAMPELIEQVKAAQSSEIDGVSGATMTSNAVKSAVDAAMSEAGFTVDANTVIGEDQTLTTDVVVIGMGASGSMAALSAAEAGANVIGIEMTSTLGGMGNAAQGMFAIGTTLQEERYGDDLGSDEEYWFNHYLELSNYLGNGQLIRTFVSEAKNTVEYLLDHDINVYLSKTAQQIAYFDDTIIYHRWGNTQPFVHLQEYLDQYNVDIHYNTTATKLLVNENNEVVGVECRNEDGSKLIVNAKSVIVATGGFAGNEAMMKEALGEEIYETVSVMGGSDGSGLEMMYEVGAGKGELLSMNHGVGPKSQDVQVADQLTLNSPVLWVNNLGQRFMAASLLKDTVDYSSAVLAQGGFAYTIVDQKTVDQWTDMSQANTGSWVHYWDRFGITDENGDPTIYHAPVDKETFLADFEVLTNTGDGKIVNTLEEAAAFIGCDAETLKATVAAYNQAVNDKYDPEFYTDEDSLIWTCETGPYYITKGYNAVLGSLGGVDVTNEMQVVTEHNEIIKGLYSTGNNVSGLSVAAYVNVEGTGLGFALTSGRLAGASAAEYAK